MGITIKHQSEEQQTVACEQAHLHENWGKETVAEPADHPEPLEPCKNREISRLPKLRVLGNIEVFSTMYYSNLSLMRDKCDFI